MEDLSALAADLIATARAMNERGVNHGTSGNVSVRIDGGMLITPSGVDYDRLRPVDVIAMDVDASWRPVGDRLGAVGAVGAEASASGLRPSSEWRFHLDILNARDEVGAVVHAHPTAATALSAHGRGIGPFHYMVGVAGGHDIRCADYATFGTPELSANALAALADRRACLLAHHGILALGSNLAAALALAVEVEVLAAQYLAALAIGEPPELTAEQMDEVLAKMASPDGYGSSPPGGSG
ncbi:MAG: class II aldolase/adducin family protein [Actinomycetota bacterium]